MTSNKNHYVLGINGLGILPSACLLKNGEILTIVEEERFTRVKGSSGEMPAKAIKYCLESERIELKDIDQIIFAWDCNYYPWGMFKFLVGSVLKGNSKAKFGRGISLAFRELLKYRPARVHSLLSSSLLKDGVVGKLPPLRFVSHHLAHAASTFYCSGFKESYILVLDGSGENQSTSIWFGSEKGIEKRRDVKIPDSLGWFYQMMTEFLGFMPNNHEGKTMALAAYGSFKQNIDRKISQIIFSDGKGNYKFNEIYAFGGTKGKALVYSEELIELLGSPRMPNDEITTYHKDLAYATQLCLESIVAEIVNDLSKNSDFNGNLCLAGGVSLNCKMNGIIEKLPQIKNLYIPPFSADNGTALGAAKIVFPVNNRINHAYWGPDYAEDELERVLLKSELNFHREADIAQSVANLLVENKVVAWFQGKMEVGARALGARSILANPCDPNLRDHINSKVKGRELWRPFAASIIEEKKFDFIEEDTDSPFMTKAFVVKKEMAQKIAGVVHIDNTSRLQIVSKEANGLYHSLIDAFGKATGVYAVLNTSFNLNEEPIVCSPQEALNSFLNSGIDYLAIGKFLVSKEPNSL